jgi:hypothetical protein
MTCRDRRDAIFLLAAGVLESGEEQDLASHLATGCARCADALTEAREALALLAQSVDPVAPPVGSRERLLARVGAAHRPRIARSAASRAARRRAAVWRVAAAASIGLALGGGAGAYAAWRWAVSPLAAERLALERRLEAARADVAELGRALAEQDRDLAELEDEARLATEALELLRADDVEVMVLAASDPAHGGSARIFWERADYGCYFHAEDLAPPSDGRRYVLWVVSAGGEHLAAASFAPDAHGDAVVVTRLPKHLAPIVRAFVTEEAAPPGDEPAGSVRLEGMHTRSARS